MDLSSALGALGLPTSFDTGSTSSGLMGMTPDQTAQMQQLQNRATFQSIIPALAALGFGIAAHPKVYGRGAALLAGLKGAGEAFNNSYQQNLNTPLQFANQARQDRNQQFQQAIGLGHLNVDQAKVPIEQQKADASTALAGARSQEVNAVTATKKPLGYDWGAPYRNIPGLKELVPGASDAPTYSAEERDKLIASWSSVPGRAQANDIAQQNADTNASRAAEQTRHDQTTEGTAQQNATTNASRAAEQTRHDQTTEGTAQQNATTNASRAAEQTRHDQAIEANKSAENQPIGTDPWAGIRTNRPDLAPILPAPELAAKLPMKSVNSWNGLISSMGKLSTTDPTYKKMLMASKVEQMFANRYKSTIFTDANSSVRAHDDFLQQMGLNPDYSPISKSAPAKSSAASAAPTPSATTTASPTAKPAASATPSATTYQSGDTLAVPADSLSKLPEGVPMRVRTGGSVLIVVRHGSTVSVL